MSENLIQRSDIPEEPRRVDIHAPESLTLKYNGDIRMTLLAGRTFLMQVAHPQVGAGVHQLSNFREDPWHRLNEINQSGQRFALLGRAAGVEEGRRLREIHRNIKGVDKDGNPFHSLNPRVYGWVHTVFLDTTLTMLRLFDTPPSRYEQEQLFEEWQEAGHLFGLRDRDMPASLEEYLEYYQHMIETTLEYNEVVDTILNMEIPRPPHLGLVPKPIWKAAATPVGQWHRGLTLFSLPPAYAEKIRDHVVISVREEKQARRMQRLMRSVIRRLPEKMRYTRAAYQARHRTAKD